MLDGCKNAFGESSGDFLRELLPVGVDTGRHLASVSTGQIGRHGVAASVYWPKWHWQTFESFNREGLIVSCPFWSLDGEMKLVFGVHTLAVPSMMRLRSWPRSPTPRLE